MSHWLDDAARGLSDGKLTRRAVLRRGGAVAGGALFASVTSPMRPLTRASAAAGTGVPCPDVPCQPPDVCCAGARGVAHCCNSATHFCCEGVCLEDGDPRTGCCHGQLYHRRSDICCPEVGARRYTCRKGEECCGTKYCCTQGERCCGDQCCDGQCCGSECMQGPQECCHGLRTYVPSFQTCCPRKPGGPPPHTCVTGEECCGAGCCKKGEQCCNSGKLAYCAPKGKCCPKGQHRVTCGKGKKALCCPEGEYCCGGKCCNPSDCHNGVCSKGNCGGAPCPRGEACCNPAMGSCVTPYPAGGSCIGDCDGKPGQTIFCCPNGGSDACGGNPQFPGDGHPACRGGQAGCVCSKGSFCPQGGCCDVSGNCLNPCPSPSDARLKRNVTTLRGGARR